MTEQRLPVCAQGVAAIVTRVDGDSPLVSRLQELGLTPGAWVRVLRVGNPLLLQVGDSRFGVRAKELFGVTVVPCANDPTVQSQEPAEEEGYSKIL